MRSTPAAILLSLLLVGCVDAADDAPDLGESTDELSVWQWPDDVQVPLQDSTRQVGLSWWNDRLHMVYTDYSSASSTNLKWSRYDGTSWSGELSVGQNSDSNPTLAPFGDRLQLIYKPVGQNRLMMTSTGGSVWTSPVTIGRSLGSTSIRSPSALAYNGKLYVAYCAHDSQNRGHVYVDRFDGTQWIAYSSWQISSGGPLCQSVVMAYMPDTEEIELIYTVVHANGGVPYSAIVRRRGTIGRSVSVWYSPEVLPSMKSAKPLSVVSCNGETHLTHGGFDGSITEIWWSYRANGNWVNSQRVPNQWSGAGATLGCFDDTETVMVHNVSGGTDLMQSIFGP